MKGINTPASSGVGIPRSLFRNDEIDVVIFTAVLALRRSLMRTCLTALGLIIGVAAVITIGVARPRGSRLD